MPRLLTIAVLLLSSVSTAAAERSEKTENALVWGGTALELSMAGVFALNFGTKLVPNHGPGMIINFTPMVIGPAVGFGARHTDPTPALAIHGASWVGLNLFMLGTLIDGRDDRHRMKIGPAAITLGAAGALAGGYLGAARVDRGDETSVFMLAPAAGFAAGGIAIGGMLVLIGGIDGDKAPSQFATGAVAGLTIGLAAATYVALRSDNTTDSTLALPTPTISPSHERILVSLGGSF
jgi:hypothetical protein